MASSVSLDHGARSVRGDSEVIPTSSNLDIGFCLAAGERWMQQQQGDQYADSQIHRATSFNFFACRLL